MRPFNYSRATNSSDAMAQSTGDVSTKFIAGGTLLIDLMKLDVARPDRLIDINKLPLAEVKPAGNGVFIGAMVRNSDLANHPIIRRKYPILSQAILSGASAQLRNAASTGGNIMQQTRCPYFREPSMPCNKRELGSGCPAINGFSRMHAILGGSDQCIAVHPSDMCVALAVLDAVIHVSSERGERQIPFEQFHLLPGNTPHLETVLTPGELITGVELPDSDLASHSYYLKVRDRNSFSFALVSVAACLKLDGQIIREAHLALGGVATKPWRLPASERALVGRSVSQETFANAAEIGLKDAKPSKHNRFKVELAKRSITRALWIAAGGTT